MAGCGRPSRGLGELSAGRFQNESSLGQQHHDVGRLTPLYKDFREEHEVIYGLIFQRSYL